MLGDIFVSRSIMWRAVPACAAASVLLLSACSQASGHTSTGQPTPSGQAVSRRPVPSAASENRLVEQATSVVASVPGGALLEGGSERVADGIHTHPVLGKGKTYRLVLTCVGRGSARLTVGPGNSGSHTTVPCDRSAVRQRLAGNGPVRVDVTGAKGSSGVLAWRINTV